MQERRIDNRLLCAELVELVWVDGSGRPRRHIANLEDISLSGLCLNVEHDIQPGTSVQVRYGDGELVGFVRYCKFRDLGYFLGVELEEGCRWSSQHYRPEHLLDPQELLERSIRRHDEQALPA